MAAGKVTVPVNTQTAIVSNTEQWSDDGTIGGNIQPFVVLSDTAQTAFFTSGNPGFVSAVITGTPAISGTVTANAGTNLNTSLLALESGGNLATVVTNTGRIPAQGQALAAASLPVVLTAAQVITLTPPTTITANAGTGTFAVSAASLPLPTGASTSALQTTGNTSLATIATNIPAQGQALAAASLPVVLTATQLTTLTPLTTVAVTQSGAWSLSANQSTNVAQLAGTTTDTNSGTKSAGTLRVVIATDQPQLTNKLLVTPDANSAINLAQVGGASTAVGHGVAATALRVELPTDGTGVVGLISGTALIGKVGIDQTTVGTTNGVSIVASTVGGCSTLHTVVASGTNATNVKASAGTLKGVQVYNNSANIAYLKFYNTAGTPTAGSGTPVKVVIIPASTAGAGAVVGIPPEGITFATGIGFTVTGGIADNDSTSVAASAFLIEIDYK